MSQLYGADISEFQGSLDWPTFNNASNFVIIRSCFGTARQDYKFQQNRNMARQMQDQAGPLGIGYYHYAYPNYNGATAEADFFCDNVLPLREGEILALDWEEPYNGDHVQWCLEFLNRVRDRTGVKPVIYLNQSLMNSHDWTPVINGDYGLWLAQYSVDKTTVPDSKWPVVALRQWTSTDNIDGVAGNVDGDTFFGDFNAFAAYGYHVTPTPTPAPTPDPTPAPQPVPVPAPQPQPEPVPQPLPTPTPAPIPPTPPLPVPKPNPSPTPKNPIIILVRWLLHLLFGKHF